MISWAGPQGGVLKLAYSFVILITVSCYVGNMVSSRSTEREAVRRAPPLVPPSNATTRFAGCYPTKACGGGPSRPHCRLRRRSQLQAVRPPSSEGLHYGQVPKHQDLRVGHLIQTAYRHSQQEMQHEHDPSLLNAGVNNHVLPPVTFRSAHPRPQLSSRTESGPARRSGWPRSTSCTACTSSPRAGWMETRQSSLGKQSRRM